MLETLHDAKKEIRRIDHLIYVSLKYTRTVDVLISVLKRFISCIDFLMEVRFLKAIEDKQIEEIPASPISKANDMKKLFTDKSTIHIMNNYILFRKLLRSKYTKRNEYRRYVTMTVNDNGTIHEVDIDKVVEYFDEIKDYSSIVSKAINIQENV